MRRLPTRIALGFLLLGAALESPDAQAQQHLLSSLSLSEGLPQSQVWDIEQANDGFMWFATFGGGVAKFDGVEFQVFTTEQGLASNSVYGIHVDGSGTPWFATRNGVNRWEAGSLTTIPGIPRDTKVFDLTSDQRGRLWAATEAGAFALENDVFVQRGPARQIQVNALLSTSDGQLWLATSGEGAFRLDDNVWEQFTEDDGLPDNTVLSLGEGPDKAIWLGTEGGLARREPAGFTTFTVEDGLSSNRVHAIKADHQGILWLGTDLGATQFVGGVLEPLTARTLTSVPVWSIEVDHEGSVYFGTSGRGVLFYNHSPFTHLNGEDQFDDQTVWSISPSPDGNYWFGLEGGLKQFDGRTMEEVPVDDAFLGNRGVRAILHDDAGILWLGTTRGVFRWSDGRFQEILTSRGKHVNEVRAIRRGASGTLWIATLGDGAFRYDGEAIREVPEVAGKELYDVLEVSRGEAWFVGGDGVTVRNDSGVSHFSVSDGLNHQEVLAAVEDRFGRVWLGSYGGGLNVVEDPVIAGVVPVFGSVRRSDGLSDDRVLFLALDGEDGLWVGTNRGLNRLDLAAYDSTGIASVRRLGQFEGFVGIEANLHSALLDSDGAMWFGHVQGVSRLAPGRESLSAPQVPILQLTGIRLFLEDTNWRAEGKGQVAASGLPVDPRLPARQNHLTFDFVGMSFRAADRVRYRHRLDGFDEDWSPTHDQRSVTYSNLAPGSYVFRVQATLDGVSWTSKPEGFGFEIKKPYWQRWWFVLAFALGWIGGVLAFLSHRTRSLRRRQLRLETVVAARTSDLIDAREEALQAARAKGQFLANMSHEIRTPMNGVLGFARLLSDTSLDEEQKEFVEVIRSSGDSLLGIINDILDFSKMEAGKTLLDAAPFAVRGLSERVLNLMSATAVEKGINLMGVIAPDVPESLIGDEGKLQQILVNLLSNALKFTHTGEVVLEVQRVATTETEATMWFAVRDSGIGIPADRLEGLFAPFIQADASTTREYGGTGLGLSICDRLCSLMGAELEVESTEGEGSTFHFELILPIGEADSADGSTRRDALSGNRVLVVDPSVTLTRSLEAQLTYWGAQVESVQSWPAADELIRHAPPFDVAIVDLDMPGVDGQHARRLFPDMDDERLPRFLCLHSRGRHSECTRCGVGLSKPIRRQALFSAMAEAVAPGSRRHVCTPASQESVPRHALKVLVAEDNLVNRKLIGRLLERLGYDAKIVTNGQEAVEAVLAAQFDLILMDVQMPVMDGPEAARRICSEIPEGRRPKMVALTAAAQEEDRTRCLEAGMDMVLTKPIGLGQLALVLDETRQERRSGRARAAGMRQRSGARDRLPNPGAPGKPVRRGRRSGA
jgi:signal transduction histidine kinase/ligand-binding sensor domain-containing protein/DNA-binding response OmpR family regulator